jgi:hypothetical protein
VTPKSRSWGLIFDDRYKGKIAWFDDLNMLTVAGLYLRFKDPWNQSDAELRQSQQLLMAKKKERTADLVVGDEPLGGLRFGRRLDRVRVAERLGADEEEGAEGRLHAAEGEAGRVGRHVHAAEGLVALAAAHAYVDAWSSAKSGKWLEDNYGYGHANVKARPSSSDLLRALKIANPRAVTLPNAYLDRDIPRRALYAKMWQEVKAS